MNFFRKDDKKKKNKKPAFQNPLARGNRSFGGEGQSLGGTRPGTLLPVRLEHPGSLGVKIEKRPNSQGTAIVYLVVAGSQAEAAGLQRGDVLCHAGSDGEEEIMYDQFIAMAASDQRPLVFDVRRIKAAKKTQATSQSAQSSAEAYSRKQAVIAAAEAREKANQKWNKPIPKKETNTGGALQSRREAAPLSQQGSTEPMSEEAKQAIEAAKKEESAHATQLGYNPYETSKSNAGQARTATTAMKHGTISNAEESAVPPAISAPADVGAPVSEEFEDALTTMATTNDDELVKTSLAIMRKLIVNATTKGQTSGDEETAAKFRRVRLSNPKIRAAIADLHGALDVMMSVGFQLFEEDGESYLVYPVDDKGPDWLPDALAQMQKMST